INAAVCTLVDDLGVDFNRIIPIKCGLTHEQTLDLTAIGKGMRKKKSKAKKSSSRYAQFTERYGPDVFELEAVPLPKLEEMLDEAVRSVLDVEAFNAEIEAQKQDRQALDRYRMAFRQAILDRSGEDWLGENGSP